MGRHCTFNKKAFILTDANNIQPATNNTKLTQFLCLLTTCDVSFSVDKKLPITGSIKQYDFIFIDYLLYGKSTEKLTSIISLAPKNRVVLFNCNEDNYDEKRLIFSGLQGIFYQHDRADIILKGIELLKNNETWFKRASMSKALTELLQLNHQSIQAKQLNLAIKNNQPLLTKREKSIVTLLSNGAQNKEIATTLNISPNTVKTHIYSIFRKTNSRNRIELMTWSQQTFN